MFIVIASNGSALAPATEPRIFKTFKQARAVAYKLAEQHGDPFFVFEARFVAVPATVRGVYLDEGDMSLDPETHHGAI